MEVRVTARTVRPGIRVGQEAEQPLQRLKGRPAQAESRASPAEEVALAGRRVEVTEADRSSAQDEVGRGRLEEAQREPQASELIGVGSGLERGRGQGSPPTRCSPDEALGDLGQSHQFPLGPGHERAPTGSRW